MLVDLYDWFVISKSPCLEVFVIWYLVVFTVAGRSLQCYCDGSCPNNVNKGTCETRPGGYCFSAVEEVYDEITGTFEEERTFGCMPPEENGGFLMVWSLIFSVNYWKGTMKLILEKIFSVKCHQIPTCMVKISIVVIPVISVIAIYILHSHQNSPHPLPICQLVHNRYTIWRWLPQWLSVYPPS